LKTEGHGPIYILINQDELSHFYLVVSATLFSSVVLFDLNNSQKRRMKIFGVWKFDLKY
jgi:hypothetical protein